MIKLSRARLPRTEPRMMARFLFDGSPFSFCSAEDVAAEGVVEVKDTLALELELKDEEV